LTAKNIIEQQILKIAVIGAGVVGSATGKGLISKGFDVSFIDSSQTVVDNLKRQGFKSVLPENFSPADTSVYFVSVPSYSGGYTNGLGYIHASAENIGEWVSTRDEYSLVVIRSTVLPGTTEQIIIPCIEKYSGKKAGIDFDVCVNPEYLREKTSSADFENPWLIVIGENNKKGGNVLERIYHWVSCPIRRISIIEAETQKFIHNICNANKISFFNEMRLVCDKLGVDADHIFPLVAKSAESLWNPVYGIRNFGAFGGACLPKDSDAFLQFAKDKLGSDLKLVKAVLAVNSEIASNSSIKTC
jgi:UDPglucose 6-dehydrogenase